MEDVKQQDLFSKLKESGFSPKQVEDSNNSMPALKGKYVARVEEFKSVRGVSEKDGKDYYGFSLRCKIVKTIDGVEGKNRYVKMYYNLVDGMWEKGKKLTPEETAEFIVNIIATIKMVNELDFNDIAAEASTCNGKLCKISVSPKKKKIDDDKYEIKYDENGNPEHKFTVVRSWKIKGNETDLDLSLVEKELEAGDMPF